MKKFLFSLVITLAFGTISFGQKITFKLDNAKDTTAFLIRYYGKSLRYADTAEIKNGVVEFDGSKHQEGIYKLYLANKVYPDLILNKQDIVVEADTKNPEKSFVIKKSKENQDFTAYTSFITKNRTKANALRESMKKEKDEAKKAAYQKQIDQITEDVLNKQKEIIKNNPNKFIAALVKITQEVEIPEIPANIPDSMQGIWNYRYYRNHYFDNVDFKDDRLVYAPIIENKLDYFLNTYKRFGADTLIEVLKPTLAKLKKDGDMLRFMVHFITSWSEKSKMMGMDKLFLYMGRTYYCPTDGKALAYWMPAKNAKDMCEKIDKLERVVIGRKAINLILPDSTEENWHHLYSMNKEYTILYFWDPNCGHCKKTTPKLERLYKEKFKDRNVGIYSVAKATGKDFEDWKKFIQKHDLTFLNVGLTKNVFERAMEDPSAYAGITNSESLNYARTYDVYSTPRVFVLDKDKKILAKQLSIAQLEDYIDHLQGKSDLPKIFKIEDEKPEDKPPH